jgi:DNA mismatch repair ATPase MutL
LSQNLQFLAKIPIIFKDIPGPGIPGKTPEPGTGINRQKHPGTRKPEPGTGVPGTSLVVRLLYNTIQVRMHHSGYQKTRTNQTVELKTAATTTHRQIWFTYSIDVCTARPVKTRFRHNTANQIAGLAGLVSSKSFILYRSPVFVDYVHIGTQYKKLRH